MMQASESVTVKAPNPKELKEFSCKLQVTFINYEKMLGRAFKK